MLHFVGEAHKIQIENIEALRKICRKQLHTMLTAMTTSFHQLNVFTSKSTTGYSLSSELNMLSLTGNLY